MRTNFVISAITGTYFSPEYNVTTLDNFNYAISFEFYNDQALTIPSIGVTGTITANGKFSTNGSWFNIPNSNIPSTINASNPLSPQFAGIIQQLQIITSGMTNTNWINIIIDASKST